MRRSKISFEQWFKRNLKDYATDIANHGADSGYPHITYTSDCVRLYNRFEEEIWDKLSTDASDFGHKNTMEFVATFQRSDMLNDPTSFKNLLVWYMCERTAQSYVSD